MTSTTTTSPQSQLLSSSPKSLASQLESLLPPPPPLPPSLGPSTLEFAHQPYSPLTPLSAIPIPSPSVRLTMKALMASGFHFGHSPQSYHPFMLPYIYGSRSGINIINLDHTLTALRRAMSVTKEIAMRGGYILFIGTKPSIHQIVVRGATRASGYWITDWKSGIFTNKERLLQKSSGWNPDKINVKVATSTTFSTSRGSGKSSSKGGRPPKLSAPKAPKVPLPDLVILVDTINLQYAANECNLLRIPVIALCDTNVNPKNVTFPVPGNDDSLTSVELFVGCLSLAAKEGSDWRKARVAERTSTITGTR